MSSRKISIPITRLLLNGAPPPDDAEPTEPADHASKHTSFGRPYSLLYAAAVEAVQRANDDA